MFFIAYRDENWKDRAYRKPFIKKVPKGQNPFNVKERLKKQGKVHTVVFIGDKNDNQDKFTWDYIERFKLEETEIELYDWKTGKPKNCEKCIHTYSEKSEYCRIKKTNRKDIVILPNDNWCISAICNRYEERSTNV